MLFRKLRVLMMRTAGNLDLISRVGGIGACRVMAMCSISAGTNTVWAMIPARSVTMRCSKVSISVPIGGSPSVPERAKKEQVLILLEDCSNGRAAPGPSVLLQMPIM